MRYVLFFRNLLSYISHFFILQFNKNSQSVARDFPEELKKISSCVHEFVSSVYEKEEGVVIKPFNTAVVLLYYDRKDEDRDYVQIHYHRDQRFNCNGEFILSQNCQLEHSFTCVLSIGDTRSLNFQLHRNTPMKDLKEVRHTSFQLSHGSLFVLHPSDEKPRMRDCLYSECNSFFKHGDVRFGSNKKLSMGIAFRTSIHSFEVCKRSGKFIIPRPSW
jgi:hypothetical protein